MSNPFSTDDMAAGYATARPPVHPRILAKVRPHLPGPIARALDIGCGAGLSTRALHGVALHSIGMEPVEAMLQWTHTVAPDGDFVVGVAESIPLTRGAADLMTAAGSLNYVSLDRFFPEARRVLSPAGILVVYDFSTGRRFAGAPGLESWFEEFQRRYPLPPREAHRLDPSILRGLDCGFEVRHDEAFDVDLAMSLPAYLDYLMTETNVAAAVRAGAVSRDIRHWCEDTLSSLWSDRMRTVLFDGYFACMAPSVH
ncbi:MAG: class I SAM-dependent methyltransferase [Actinomycetota bacterium]|nr:class I SAM-dependent methyltransferase [Actinomycetota bacterium]